LVAVTRLIIHADDFGLTPGVTRGILEAHAAGVVTSTSVMVGTPGWPDAIDRLRAHPSLDVGLHFNLLVGHPGTLPALVARALTGRIDVDAVRAECAAQLAELQATGARVTHIDSHRHTHALPGVWDAVQSVAAAEGLHVRIPSEPWRTARTPRLAAQLHRAAVSASAWRPSARRSAPIRFTGLTLNGADDFEAGILRTLDGLGPGVTELMVHPGHVDPPLAAVDSYTWQRERELAALLAPTVANRLARGDIALTSFAYI
jgi:chitin disaccharide deacetylase